VSGNCCVEKRVAASQRPGARRNRSALLSLGLKPRSGPVHRRNHHGVAACVAQESGKGFARAPALKAGDG